MRSKELMARILVIDDEPAICRLLERRLSTSHEVATASNGNEALLLLAKGERFDVVFCDLQMPGLSGADLHARVAVLDRELSQRFIFMTGALGDFAGRVELARLPNRVLLKPFAHSDVLKAITELAAPPPSNR